MENFQKSALQVLNYNNAEYVDLDQTMLTEQDYDCLTGDGYDLLDCWKEPILEGNKAFLHALSINISKSYFLANNFHSRINSALSECNNKTELDFIHRFYCNFIRVRENQVFVIHLESYIYEFLYLKNKNSDREKEHFELFDLENVTFKFNNEHIQNTSIQVNEFIVFLANLIYLEAISFNAAKRICEYLSLKESFNNQSNVPFANSIDKHILKDFLKLKSII